MRLWFCRLGRVVIFSLILVGCAPVPHSQPIPATPYDIQLDGLNQRLCLEHGGIPTFIVEVTGVQLVCEGIR